jgi:hypothetical protein
MAPRIDDRRKFADVYLLIASAIRDESQLAYALDLYDAIEEARVLRNAEVQKGNEHTVLAIEEVRNRHITKLSALMSSCRSREQ